MNTLQRKFRHGIILGLMVCSQAFALGDAFNIEGRGIFSRRSGELIVARCIEPVNDRCNLIQFYKGTKATLGTTAKSIDLIPIGRVMTMQSAMEIEAKAKTAADTTSTIARTIMPGMQFTKEAWTSTAGIVTYSSLFTSAIVLGGTFSGIRNQEMNGSPGHYKHFWFDNQYNNDTPGRSSEQYLVTSKIGLLQEVQILDITKVKGIDPSALLSKGHLYKDACGDNWNYYIDDGWYYDTAGHKQYNLNFTWGSRSDYAKSTITRISRRKIEENTTIRSAKDVENFLHAHPELLASDPELNSKWKSFMRAKENEKWAWVGVSASFGVAVVTPIFMDLVNNIVVGIRRANIRNKTGVTSKKVKSAFEALILEEDNSTGETNKMMQVGPELLSIYEAIIRGLGNVELN